MPLTTLERRIGALEALVERYGGDDGEYVIELDDVNGDRCLINGIEVSASEFDRRAPRSGPFVVDIGEEEQP